MIPKAKEKDRRMESIKLVNMEKSTIFVVMDSNSTPKRLPAEEGKKSVSESFQKDGQEVNSQARSLLNPYQGGKFDWQFKRKSGFAMARLVCLLILLSSCSYNLSPTTAQRERQKFERFKIAPREALIYSGTAFASYGLGKHFANLKLKD